VAPEGFLVELAHPADEQGLIAAGGPAKRSRDAARRLDRVEPI